MILRSLSLEQSIMECSRSITTAIIAVITIIIIINIILVTSNVSVIRNAVIITTTINFIIDQYYSFSI